MALFENTAKKIRPHEEPFVLGFEEWNQGAWLFQHLEAAFGNKVEVRRVESRAQANTVEVSRLIFYF